jgi:cysteine synthase A
MSTDDGGARTALVASSVLELIGATPLIRLRRMTAPGAATVWAKCEHLSPGGSVKDRIALAMIELLEREHRLERGAWIVEPTSGNTGIGLAFTCAARGYQLAVTMPESMSLERQRLLKAFGAKLYLTPRETGMRGAVSRAVELFQEFGGEPKAFIPQQFKNPANPEVHRRTTAEEIWRATGGNIDILVSGVGTGGTITGCGEVLKARKPGVKCVAVEPTASPVLTQHLVQGVPRDQVKPGPHKIQGIGAGFIPDVLNTAVIDEVVQVTDDESFEMARRLAKEEGMLCGISCGAATAAAVRVAQRPENAGKLIVVVLPDLGERYLSTALYPQD